MKVKEFISMLHTQNPEADVVFLDKNQDVYEVTVQDIEPDKVGKLVWFDIEYVTHCDGC